MEGGSAALPVSGGMPKHMLALAKAQRRVREIAQLKRDVREGRLSAADALSDPRASGAVTVGQVLEAQRGWGERSSIVFLSELYAPATVMVKRVESLTERQRELLRRALGEPFSPISRDDRW